MCTRTGGLNDLVGAGLRASSTANQHMAHVHVEPTSFLVLPGRCFPLPACELRMVMRLAQVSRWVQARSVLKDLPLSWKQVIHVRVRSFEEDVYRGKVHFTVPLIGGQPSFSVRLWEDPAPPLVPRLLRAWRTPGLMEPGLRKTT